MNIDQYRAFKAQEASKVSAPAPTPTVAETTIAKPVETTPAVSAPTIDYEKMEVEIEGVKVPFSELKNGYLRQSDYTQKTQEVSRQRREVQDAVTFYEQIKANPELIKQVATTVQVPPALDPASAKILELEGKVYDMMLDKEISTLQSKYSDFEIKDVLAIAQKKGLTNLEDAYFISKSTKQPAQTISQTDLEKQLREKIMKELEAEKTATQTIIGTPGSPAIVQDSSPKLNPDEQKVARMMFRNEKDPYAVYALWRDTDKRKK